MRIPFLTVDSFYSVALCVPLISGHVANSEVLQLSEKLANQPSKTMVAILFD
jgi:hypothetical protein